MPDEQVPPPPPSPKPFPSDVAAIGLGILAAGATCLLVLVSGSMRSTQGARASTRLRWERRAVELDRAVERAKAEGKLP